MLNQSPTVIYESLLRNLNRVIHVEKNLRYILQFACEQIVQILEFPRAMITIKESDGSMPVEANAGHGYPQYSVVRWDDSPLGQGTVGNAVRTGRTQIFQVQGNPVFGHWQTEILDRYPNGAIASLPLKDSNNVLGVLTVYSEKDDSFNEQIIELMENYGVQLAIAIREAKYRQNIMLYRSFFEFSQDIILLLDLEGRILDANSAAVKAYGYTNQELTEMTLFHLQEGDVQSIRTQLQSALDQGVLYEAQDIRKTGMRFPVQVSSHRIIFEDRELLLSIIRDMSDWQKTQKDLKHSRERYQEMFEHMKDGAMVLSVINEGEDFVVKELNSAGEKTLGLPRNQVLGYSVQKLQESILIWDFMENMRRVWLSGEPVEYPLIKYHQGHIALWYNFYIYKLLTGEIVAIFSNHTVLKQVEEQVWLEKEKAQVTLNSIGDAVVTTDLQGNITYLNTVAEKLSGWKNAEVIGKPFTEVFMLCNEISGNPVPNPVQICLEENRILTIENSTVFAKKNGEIICIEDSCSPIHDRDNQAIGAVFVFHDVTQKRLVLKQLSYQAQHDVLTGLPNRMYFYSTLCYSIKQAKRNEEKVAVLFLDMDKFKYINDTFGHEVGDLVLKGTADRLVGTLREGDVVARLGGDEFLIVLPEICNPEDVEKVCEKLLDAFEEPILILSLELPVRLSIGISIYPDDSDVPEDLIKLADGAMYEAKNLGGRTYHFFNKRV